MNYTVDAASVQ